MLAFTYVLLVLRKFNLEIEFKDVFGYKTLTTDPFILIICLFT